MVFVFHIVILMILLSFATSTTESSSSSIQQQHQLSSLLLSSSSSRIRRTLLSAKFTSVLGYGGAPLNVMEMGNPKGPPILFIHGMSMNHLCFMPQYYNEHSVMDNENKDAIQKTTTTTPTTDLSHKFRIVSFDLRGHGNSAKPWSSQDVAPSHVWADDIEAILEAKQLHKPIVVAWSFGGYVIADYVRKYGTSKLGAINFVGTTGGLIEQTFPVTIATTTKNDNDNNNDREQQEQKQQYPSLEELKEKAERAVSGNLVEALVATEENLQLMEFTSMTPEYRETLRLASVMICPYFRKVFTQYNLDHQDVTSKLCDIPLLVSWGEQDPFVNSDCYRRLQTALPWAEFSTYPKCKHFVFVEEAGRFNLELDKFIERVWKEHQSTC